MSLADEILRDSLRGRRAARDAVKRQLVDNHGGGQHIPEYYPPPRTEAWLTLPPGVVVARDDPDWEPRTMGSMPRYPQVRSEVAMRFRNKFGNQAALDWDLEPDPSWLLDKTLKEVWSDDAISTSFYRDMPGFFPDHLKT